MQLSAGRAVGAVLALALAGPLTAADDLRVVVRASGPTPAQMRVVGASLARVPAKLKLASHRWAVLAVQVLPAPPAGPYRFLATLYDYTANQAWTAEGPVAAPEAVTTRTLDGQPLPSAEEFREALNVLRRSSPWREALARGAVVPFRPMPPVLDSGAPTDRGAADRTVNVGLLSPTPGTPGQIVGVDMVDGSVVTYPGGVPSTSLAIASATSCGPADSAQATTPRGTAGQADVTISRGGVTLWQFTVIRPSVSSGTNGSGIEFVNVRYKGKTLLSRAHTPILNVRYVNDLCGPYRDWQWEEDPFSATGSTVAPGILNASSMPSTILDSNNDTGNFSGVAYYVGASSVVFQTELRAGWYRYVPRWTFDDNGTIHARVGFAGIDNGCVCNIHLHNAFFRLDFDVDGAANTVISRRTQGGWQQMATEASGRRDRLSTAEWQVKNPSTGDTYQVTPGPYDYIADAFGVGDWWILQSKGTAEIDDGISCVTCSNAYIQIGSFVNGESVQNTKVVLWYGGHFLHNLNDGYPTSGGEVVGPDIAPISW